MNCYARFPKKERFKLFEPLKFFNKKTYLNKNNNNGFIVTIFYNHFVNQQVDFIKHGALIQPFIPDGNKNKKKSKINILISYVYKINYL